MWLRTHVFSWLDFLSRKNLWSTVITWLRMLSNSLSCLRRDHLEGEVSSALKHPAIQAKMSVGPHCLKKESSIFHKEMREGPLWTNIHMIVIRQTSQKAKIYTWTESAEERAVKWKTRRRIRFFTIVVVSECALSAFSYLLFSLISSRWEQLTL